MKMHNFKEAETYLAQAWFMSLPPADRDNIKTKFTLEHCECTDDTCNKVHFSPVTAKLAPVCRAFAQVKAKADFNNASRGVNKLKDAGKGKTDQEMLRALAVLGKANSYVRPAKKLRDNAFACVLGRQEIDLDNVEKDILKLVAELKDASHSRCCSMAPSATGSACASPRRPTEMSADLVVAFKARYLEKFGESEVASAAFEQLISFARKQEAADLNRSMQQRLAELAEIRKRAEEEEAAILQQQEQAKASTSSA